MAQSLDSHATSSQEMAYLELERKLHRVQAQRAQDLQSTTSQLLDIEVILKQLDPRLDSLEAKAVQSMHTTWIQTMLLPQSNPKCLR